MDRGPDQIRRMMACSLDVLEASAITQSLVACIIQPGREDLLLCKGKSIELYRVDDTKQKLQLWGIYTFNAVIRAAERIISSDEDDEVDRLLLRFETCKLSVVQFSPKMNTFLTVSLHFFEDEQEEGGENHLLLKNPNYDPTSCLALEEGRRLLASSPDGRCAITRINSGNFGLLKFDLEEDEKPSLVFGSKRIDERVGTVLDFTFLHGFIEPTMAVIYEPSSNGPNWPAFLAVRKETVEIIVVTINLHSEEPSFTTIFHRDGIPSECRKVLPVPKPIGGALIAGPNLFLHLDHVGSTTVCSLNNFAHIASPKIVTRPTSLDLVSSGNLCFMADPSVALWSTAEGDWYWMRMVRSGGRGVTAMTVDPVKDTVLGWPTSFTLLPSHDMLFVGCLTGSKHQLFKTAISISAVVSPNNHAMTDDLYGNDDDDLYGGSSTNRTTSDSAITDDSAPLKLVMSLPCIGPISDFCIGSCSETSSFEIVAVGGQSRWGHATTIHPSIPLSTQTSFNLSGATRAFVLPPSYLAISTEDSTMLMETRADRMAEVEETLFCLEEKTVLAGVMSDGLILQVTPNGYRILSSDTQLVHSQVETQSIIEDALLSGELLFLLLHGGQVQIVAVQTGVTSSLALPSPAKQISFTHFTGCLFLSILFVDGSFALYDESSCLFQTAYLSHLPQAISNGSKLAAVSPGASFEVSSVHLFASDSLLLAAFNKETVTIYRYLDQMLVKVFAIPYKGDGRIVSKFASFLGSSNGLIVDGELLLMLGPLGYPRIHMLSKSFSSLSTFGSEGKFIGISQDGSVSVLALPNAELIELDSPVPFTPHHFDRAIQQICYNPSAECYAVVTSLPGGRFQFPDDDYSNIADNKEWKVPVTIVDPSKSLPNPTATRYSFGLLQNWRLIDEHQLEEYELVVTSKAMSLNTKETTEGRKSFMVLGVVQVKGEDRPVRSRVLIFDAIQLVPEPGQLASTGLRLKLLTDHPLKTTISALTQISGHVAITSGFKTIIHEFEDNDSLTGVAFIDAGVHLTAGCSIRSLLWLGDCGGHRGLGLYAFQERPPKLLELGRIIDPVELDHPVLQIECMVNTETGQMVAVSADDKGRLSFHLYSPASLATLGGTRLAHQGTFNLGCRVIQMHPILIGANVAIIWMSPGGAMGVITPIDEDQFKALNDLQTKVASDLPQLAGLHPKGCRGSPPNRQLVDASLLHRQFSPLPRLVQARLSSDPAKILQSHQQLQSLVAKQF